MSWKHSKNLFQAPSLNPYKKVDAFGFVNDDAKAYTFFLDFYFVFKDIINWINTEKQQKTLFFLFQVKK